MKTTMDRFMEKVVMIPLSGCWLWNGCSHPTGYGRFSVIKGSVEYAHRASWMLFRGDIPRGMYVCHVCDIGYCVNPDHLFIGSAKDNMQDASKKGRIVLPPAEAMLKAEDQPMSKLRNVDVITIRSSNDTNKSLARFYGVDQAVISNIRHGKSYRSVI